MGAARNVVTVGTGRHRRFRSKIAVALVALAASPALSVLGAFSSASPAGATTQTCKSAGAPSAAQLASTTGVTSSSITVGNVSTVGGVVPGLFEGAPTGVRAYFAYINSKGGVHGRKLVLQGQDDGLNGQQNKSEVSSAVGSDFAMVGSFSLEDSYGCPSFAADPAVSDVSVTLDPGTNALPNDFSAQPLAQGASLGPINYLKAKYPKDKKVGTIIATFASASAQWAGEEAAFKHAGYQIAYQQKVGPLTSDFTTQVEEMKSAGVNFVYLTDLDWQVGAIFTKDMAEQNWHPAVVLSGGPIYADQYIAKAGGASATKGFWLGQAQALYLGQDAPRLKSDKLFLKWVKNVSASWIPDLFTLYGWGSAQLFVQALTAAGPNPTRGSLLAALGKITKFTTSGLLAPVNPAAKTPASCYVMGQIKNGKYVRVNPPKSGFACNAKFFYATGSSH